MKLLGLGVFITLFSIETPSDNSEDGSETTFQTEFSPVSPCFSLRFFQPDHTIMTTHVMSNCEV